MSIFRQGAWQISSVQVNSESVEQPDDIQHVEIDGDEIVIQPACYRFTVIQFDGDHAVLESADNQIYQAEFAFEDETLVLRMSMPGVEEMLEIMAKYSPAMAPA